MSDEPNPISLDAAMARIRIFARGQGMTGNEVLDRFDYGLVSLAPDAPFPQPAVMAARIADIAEQLAKVAVR